VIRTTGRRRTSGTGMSDALGSAVLGRCPRGMAVRPCHAPAGSTGCSWGWRLYVSLCLFIGRPLPGRAVRTAILSFSALRTSGVRRACFVAGFSVCCSLHTGLRTSEAASVPSSVLMPLHKILAASPSRFVLLFSAHWAWYDNLHDSVTARLSLCRAYENDVSVLSILYGDGLFSASKLRSV